MDTKRSIEIVREELLADRSLMLALREKQTMTISLYHLALIEGQIGRLP
jgi:hypothetical protein